MTSPQVYGWGVLIAGAAIAYGMAKPSIDERRRIATENGQRPLEIKTCTCSLPEVERVPRSLADDNVPCR